MLVLINISSLLLVQNTYAGNVLSAGVDHVCGIKDDNTLICWGDNSQNQADPPDGTFKEVSAGFYFNCALSTKGKVACWGRDTAGETSPPPGQFIQIETGGNHACALAANGSPICWGKTEQSYGYLTQIDFSVTGSGGYQQNLGSPIFCGLKADKTLSCPSLDTVPSGIFSYVTVGGINVCNENCGNITAVQDRRFDSFACGIRENGVVACWGVNNNDRATPPVGVTLKQPTGFTPPAVNTTCNDGGNGVVINQDLSLNINKAQYNTLTGNQTLWIDLTFSGQNEKGDLMWILSDYGEVE